MQCEICGKPLGADGIAPINTDNFETCGRLACVHEAQRSELDLKNPKESAR